MAKIQIVFKGKNRDVIINGETVDEIISEYNKIERKLGKLIPIVSPSPSSRDLVGASAKESSITRILALKTEGFFQQPKDIGEIQSQLVSLGYHYVQTSLSGPLLKLVRKKELRRYQAQKENKKIWVYVNP